MDSKTGWTRRLLATALAALLTLTAAFSQAEETITYIHWDAQGSPVAATDEDGNVVWRESYRPYGERIDNEPAAGPHSRWYTGHPQDEDTGLIYAGARYYDPVIGRFLGPDPVEFQEDNLHSFNRYAYGNNNPYVYMDRNGREAQSVLGDVPANPKPGTGTWITAGIIAAPLGVGVALSRAAVAVGTEWALGEIGFSASGAYVLTKSVDPRGLGPLGEAASSALTGLPKNSRRIPSASGQKEFRIPDHMTSDQRYIGETKNVNRQSLTSQLLDDKAYVLRGGRPGRVDVIVDNRTEISAPLLREHLNPGSPLVLRSENLKGR